MTIIPRKPKAKLRAAHAILRRAVPLEKMEIDSM